MTDNQSLAREKKLIPNLIGSGRKDVIHISIFHSGELNEGDSRSLSFGCDMRQIGFMLLTALSIKTRSLIKMICHI